MSKIYGDLDRNHHRPPKSAQGIQLFAKTAFRTAQMYGKEKSSSNMSTRVCCRDYD